MVFLLRGALAASSVDPLSVEAVYFGNVMSSGLGQNPANQIALKSGCIKTNTTMTVNKVCASGLKAIELGARDVMDGLAEVKIPNR
jgi:acetyl-CoA C-acetyltransferase